MLPAWVAEVNRTLLGQFALYGPRQRANVTRWKGVLVDDTADEVAVVVPHSAHAKHSAEDAGLAQDRAALRDARDARDEMVAAATALARVQRAARPGAPASPALSGGATTRPERTCGSRGRPVRL